MMLRLSQLPQRYVFAVMGFLATLFGYMMRISLDVTISHMVNETIKAVPELYDPYSCPGFHLLASNQSDPELIPDVKPGPFDWDESTQTKLKSAFRKSYIMTQVIGGMVADQRGGKKFMGIVFLVLSICTFVSPFASKLLGQNSLYVLRFISGMASGTFIPVLLSMMSKWVPVDERAFIGSIIFPGALLGHVAGLYLGEVLLSTVGWEAVYYTFGVFGITWCCLWKYFVFSDPNTHPYISESEKRYLNSNVKSLIRTTKYDWDPLPWKAFLRCGALWGTIVGYIGREWAFSIFTVQVPQYLKDVLRLDIKFIDYLSYMPYICMWLAALFFGFTCDIIIKKGYCSVKNTRKMFTFIAASGSCLCMIMIMYAGCSRSFALFCMFTGMVFLGSYYSGCMIGALDIAPNYAGCMISVIDNIAINTVLLLPPINSIIITDALLSQWRTSFWIVIIILMVTLSVYFYYAQAEQMWWDDVRKNGYPQTWKHGLFGCEGVIDENGKSVYITKKQDTKDTKLSEDINDLS